MSAEVTRLTLAVDSTQVKTASRDLDSLSAAGTRAERSAGGIRSAFTALRGVFAGFAAAQVAQQIVKTADAYSNLNARLFLVTKTTAEFNTAQRELFSIAQQTGTGLEQTSDLFGSLSRSTEALGVSQSRVLEVTKTINQALAVSGTSAQGAQAALVQLGQGFAAGALRGEELNSVLEQAPRLARAIADGLGVTVGQLRELGQAGKLTGEEVFRALEKSGSAISGEFARLPLTVGRATTEAGNALLKLVGNFDQLSGASGGLASVISSAASAISEFADELKRASQGADDVNLLAEYFVTLSEVLRVLGANVAFVFKGIGREIGAVSAQIAALARLDIKGFRAISDAVKEDAARARAELDALEKRILTRTAPSNEFDAEDARLARSGRRTPAPSPTARRTGGAPRVSDAERYLESLRKQLQATQDLSAVEKVLEDIQAGRLGKITEKQKEAALGIAIQLDAQRAFDQAQRESQEQAQQFFRQQEEARAAQEREQKALADAGRRVYEETRTPAEALANEIERLNGLLEKGAIDWDTYARAQFAAQDSFDKATEAANSAAQKVDNTARDLGLTFASAFENAIVEGNNLRDVLGGLEKDILRIVTRKLITEPLGDAVGGFAKNLGGGGGGGIFSSIFSSIFGGGRAMGGPVSAGSLYRINETGQGPGEVLNVGGSQYLLAAQNGSINPNGAGGGVSVVNNFNLSGPVDRRTQQQIAAAAGDGVRRATARLN